MKIIQPTIFFFEIRKHSLISKELFRPKMHILQLSATTVLWALQLTEPSHGTWTIHLAGLTLILLVCAHTHMCTHIHTPVFLSTYYLSIYLFISTPYALGNSLCAWKKKIMHSSVSERNFPRLVHKILLCGYYLKIHTFLSSCEFFF